ncbi:VOC family protein [Halodesulfovibrio aestuarii]|uniref:VOC family protein n=1 Tax=Halodesulfovibrio aestuarii TaxID=126333 RepID=A0ABV4JS32_9BACT
MNVEIDHLTLNVESPDACVAFYHEVIGLLPENYDAWKQGKAKFPSVRINTHNMIHFFPPDMWKEMGYLLCSPGKGNHVCLAFAEKEWTALLHRLEEREIKMRGPLTLTGARGTGTSIFINDPEGFTVELKTYDHE